MLGVYCMSHRNRIYSGEKLRFQQAMSEIDDLEPLQDRDGYAQADNEPRIKDICLRYKLDHGRVMENIKWEDSRGLLGKYYFAGEK